MTRFEMLQRFAADSRTHRDHMTTFMVLTEMWVNSGKPERFEPDFDCLIAMLRAPRRSVFRWLAELETYGFTTYQRGKNQNSKSVIGFSGSVQNGTANSSASVQYGTVTPSASVRGGTATHSVVSNMAQRTDSGSVQYGTADESVVSDMAQRGSVQHGTATPKTAQKRGFSELSTSAEDDLSRARNHHLTYTICTINLSKGDDEKGVQGEKQKRTKREKPIKTVDLSHFADSPLADLAAFRTAFADDVTGKAADLDHYHGRLLAWRDKRGNVPQRADWLSTARTFMLNDYREGKLVTHPTHPQSHVTSAHHRSSNSRALIEPPATRVFGW